MNGDLGDRLDDLRDERAGGRQEDARLVRWLNHGVAPEERLLSFDRWVSERLATRLDWAWAGALKEKRIEQCRIYLEKLVLGLWRRGWMLDGHRLAAHIDGVLERVATYQRSGKVREFWPYFQATVDRYVGANSEELQLEARSVGVHMGQIVKCFGITRREHGVGGKVYPALPELVAQRADETLREKLARRRRTEAAAAEESRQERLF